MNERELKQLWQGHTVPEPQLQGDQELIARMKRKMTRFERTIFWRDLREIAACVMIVLLLAPRFFHHVSAMTRIGDVIIVMGCVLICLTLVIARHRDIAQLRTESLRETLVAEIKRVTRQVRLLRTVVWWYAGPLLIGAMLGELGFQQSAVVKGIVLLALALAGLAVWWINQRAAGQLTGLRAQLEDTLNQIPEFTQAEDPNQEEKA